MNNQQNLASGKQNHNEQEISLKDIDNEKLAIKPEIRRIAAQIYELNKILTQNKTIVDSIEWAEDINRLAPDTDSEHLKFALDAVKVGALYWDTFKGIQNIFRILNETKLFWNEYKSEKAFKRNRAEWINKNGINAFRNLVFKRYSKCIQELTVKPLEIHISKRNARKQSGKKTSQKAEKILPELNNLPLADRHLIFKVFLVCYVHPLLHNQEKRVIHNDYIRNKINKSKNPIANFRAVQTAPIIDIYTKYIYQKSTSKIIARLFSKGRSDLLDCYHYDLLNTGITEDLF